MSGSALTNTCTCTLADTTQAIGTQSKRVSWFSKWFWECWFEFDNVHLHGSRREYLEYKMGTIKLYNGRNNFLQSWFVQIP